MTAALPVIVGFLLALTALGAWYSRRIKTADDFALAGRRLGAPVLAGTLIATWIGTGSLFGNTEFTYENGVAGFFLPLSGLLGMMVLAFLAPYVRKLPVATVPQIIGLRFGRKAQILGALALIGAYLVIVSYQYRAGAAVAERIFPNIPRELLPVGFALFIILYTALAGMVSVALTDVFNGVVMAAGLLIALALLFGGWDPQANPLAGELLRPGAGMGAIGWVNVMLPAFLLMLGDANLYQRFLSAKSPSAAKRAAIGTFFGLLVLETSIIALALLSRVLLPEEPANHGHAIIETAFVLLPPVVGVMLAATAVAVIVSTADSYLLACSTTAATDLGGGMTTSFRQRVLVVILGLLALWISTWSDRFLKVALYAYTLYGASLTPAVLCAILRPKTSRNAVVGGMAAGLGTALAWKGLLESEMLPVWLSNWDPVLPALLANLLVLALLEVMRRRGRF